MASRKEVHEVDEVLPFGKLFALGLQLDSGSVGRWRGHGGRRYLQYFSMHLVFAERRTVRHHRRAQPSGNSGRRCDSAGIRAISQNGNHSAQWHPACYVPRRGAQPLYFNGMKSGKEVARQAALASHSAE